MSYTRQSLYENSDEPWEKNVPADLVPAIKHLRKTFDDVHWGCGQSTKKYCYSVLHAEPVDDPDKEYLNYLLAIRATVGTVADERFNYLMKQNTLPARFRALFDLYLGGVTVQALVIFKELAEIGRANEERLKMPHLEWAEAQTKNLIRSNNHLIRMWVKDVCDKHVYDPSEDREEQIYWRKWQAPMYLIMKPSRYAPYNAETVWERNDPETSSQLLQVFAEHYVLHLEGNVKRAAGEAALALAKQPQPVRANATTDDPKLQNTPASEGMTQQSGPAIRREAHKLNTKAVYAKWQKEYRKLKKSRPGKSNVWYSQHISRLAMAEDHSAETIRKHMTK